mmetsp:Transcript_56078/g.64333  ORF Transcript_56078/g.64333 Transcript_56078/m.64333 type:complete len:649 (-) Transcript_56078:837-2783(-)|eukprot:CAMPEP_0176424872 /NCGR_PEP_ID=MMETSP0127-20121128/11079_1 /TAXON_ID=938130 /ORGANISM="Platyophrya macrostoma, Strain WH" /LENGTH=648 /DNA_ID=CAMNT_0017805979 /DNA_START=203 /DNA_END=2149 /DNA_ORIENTATION=-
MKRFTRIAVSALLVYLVVHYYLFYAHPSPSRILYVQTATLTRKLPPYVFAEHDPSLVHECRSVISWCSAFGLFFSDEEWELMAKHAAAASGGKHIRLRGHHPTTRQDDSITKTNTSFQFTAIPEKYKNALDRFSAKYHVNHQAHTLWHYPLSFLLCVRAGFCDEFPFITPNMISVLHVLVAVVSCVLYIKASRIKLHELPVENLTQHQHRSGVNAVVEGYYTTEVAGVSAPVCEVDADAVSAAAGSPLNPTDDRELMPLFPTMAVTDVGTGDASSLFNNTVSNNNGSGMMNPLWGGTTSHGSVTHTPLSSSGRQPLVARTISHRASASTIREEMLAKVSSQLTLSHPSASSSSAILPLAAGATSESSGVVVPVGVMGPYTADPPLPSIVVPLGSPAAVAGPANPSRVGLDADATTRDAAARRKRKLVLIATVLFAVRNWLDALDGVMARYRRLQMSPAEAAAAASKPIAYGWNGHLMDTICDSLGGLLCCVGIGLVAWSEPIIVPRWLRVLLTRCRIRPSIRQHATDHRWIAAAGLMYGALAGYLWDDAMINNVNLFDMHADASETVFAVEQLHHVRFNQFLWSLASADCAFTLLIFGILLDELWGVIQLFLFFGYGYMLFVWLYSEWLWSVVIGRHLDLAALMPATP